MAKRGKAAAPPRGAQDCDGGGSSRSSAARKRDEGGGASPAPASEAGQQAQHIVAKLSRSALEELVLASLCRPNTLQEISAHLPQAAPALTAPVGDDARAVNLGPLFSRVPNAVVIDILLRLNFETRLAWCLTLSKGFRIFRREPAIFEDVNSINSKWLSSAGLRRLLAFLPDQGQQVLPPLPDTYPGRADAANAWPGGTSACPSVFESVPTLPDTATQVQKLKVVNEKITPKDWAFLISSCSPACLRVLSITGRLVAAKVLSSLKDARFKSLVCLSLPEHRGCLRPLTPQTKSCI